MVAGGLLPLHGSKGPVQRNCLDPVGTGHPPALADALDYYRRELYYDIEFHQYLQFKFSQQWKN